MVTTGEFRKGWEAQRTKMLMQGWRPPVTGDPEDDAPSELALLITGFFLGSFLTVVVVMVLWGDLIINALSN
jgi:hypothetical protein